MGVGGDRGETVGNGGDGEKVPPQPPPVIFSQTPSRTKRRIFSGVPSPIDRAYCHKCLDRRRLWEPTVRWSGLVGKTMRDYPMPSREQAVKSAERAKRDWVAGKIDTKVVNRVVSAARNKGSR